VIKVQKNCLPLDLNNALHITVFIERRRPQRAKLFDASKLKSGYQNRIETLFDMLMFDNYKNSLNNMAIRINLKKDLGMILRHAETQATTSEETQAMMNRVSQVTTYGVLPMNDGH